MAALRPYFAATAAVSLPWLVCAPPTVSSIVASCGSNEIGALGYYDCALELAAQVVFNASIGFDQRMYNEEHLLLKDTSSFCGKYHEAFREGDASCL